MPGLLIAATTRPPRQQHAGVRHRPLPIRREAAPFPFSVSLQRGMERREAPGGLRNLLRPAVRRPASRRASGTRVSTRGGGVPGRGALARGPCASRRSIADRVVGGRTLLGHRPSRSTTSSNQARQKNLTGTYKCVNGTILPHHAAAFRADDRGATMLPANGEWT